LAFAAQGATVVIADWEDGSETLDLIKKNEGTGIFIQCDVSNVEQVNHLMDTIEKTTEGLILP
jgi:NAD(P)-dependent dehydrogenase (short-subunit alcohol dehydrogenase family)